MPFRKFFGRGNGGEPKPQQPDEDEVADEAGSDDDVADDVPPEGVLDADDIDRSWRERAAGVIPGGSSTGSKRPEALFGADAGDVPTHYVSAQGCHVNTPSGRRILDCTMALGAVSIGYSDERVNQMVLGAVAGGHVCCFPSVIEVEVAERLCDVIPCAEQVRFLKTGADAVSAAVRLARAATGRDVVVGCGYFGWHDWWTTAPGVPVGARADFVAVPFDDVPALEAAAQAAGSRLAAVVLEPVIERLPSPEWATAARRLCDTLGAVLVFDEMKTGFRLAPGGYQEYARVEPDLAAFGKAMSNGFPIAAVVGRSAVMEAANETWISSTLAGESIGLAAVSAVLDIYEQDSVCDILWRVGAQIREGVAAAIEASGVRGVRVEGIDPMWSIRFDDETLQRRFLERASSLGVLFKRGPYNFAAVAHDDESVVAEIERVASTAMVEVLEEGEE
jgi:glutamate-1-semialdehyde 2,1-aminomutase